MKYIACNVWTGHCTELLFTEYLYSCFTVASPMQHHLLAEYIKRCRCLCITRVSATCRDRNRSACVHQLLQYLPTHHSCEGELARMLTRRDARQPNTESPAKSSVVNSMPGVTINLYSSFGTEINCICVRTMFSHNLPHREFRQSLASPRFEALYPILLLRCMPSLCQNSSM